MYAGIESRILVDQLRGLQKPRPGYDQVHRPEDSLLICADSSGVDRVRRAHVIALNKPHLAGFGSAGQRRRGVQEQELPSVVSHFRWKHHMAALEAEQLGASGLKRLADVRREYRHLRYSG